MKRRVVRSDESKRDVVELADYIAQNNYGVSIRFLNAVEQTCEFLAANPHAGQLCQFKNPATEGLRVWAVEKFRNYLVYFRPADDGIVIERVLHGARDIEALFGEVE